MERAFAWPGQWLKSNYQLIDNSELGVNRQGYELRYYLDGGPFEMHAQYTDLRQIEPETTETSTQAGFVDGYYLPQLPNQATFGRQKRYAFWTAWHPAFGDLSLDIVDDHALSSVRLRTRASTKYRTRFASGAHLFAKGVRKRHRPQPASAGTR